MQTDEPALAAPSSPPGAILPDHPGYDEHAR